MNASPPLFELPSIYPLSPNSPIVNTTNIFSYQQIPSTYSSLSPSHKIKNLDVSRIPFFFNFFIHLKLLRLHVYHVRLHVRNAFITTNLIFQKSGEKCYKTRASNNGPLFFDANEKINRLLGGLH